MWYVIVAALILALVAHSRRAPRRRGRGLFVHSGPHWRRCYSRRNFLRLGIGVAGAGALAYSGADEALEGLHADLVRSRASDGVSSLLKPLGERPWFLVWAAMAGVDALWHSSAVSRWGRLNFESMCVGLPALWGLQYGLGAARPTDGTHGPRWRPFADENSASGHTFIAAIPWLNLAHSTDARGVALAARALSLGTGWSRLNDRMHYPSQIALGYGIAWHAVEAVRRPGAAVTEESGGSAASL